MTVFQMPQQHQKKIWPEPGFEPTPSQHHVISNRSDDVAIVPYLKLVLSMEVNALCAEAIFRPRGLKRRWPFSQLTLSAACR